MQQIDFTGNLKQAVNTTMFFILEEVQKNCFGGFTRNCQNIVNLF